MRTTRARQRQPEFLADLAGGAAAATSFVVVGANSSLGVNGEIDTFGNNINTCGGGVTISPANT